MKTTLIATATASGGVYILKIDTADGVEPTPAQIAAELAKSQQSGTWSVIDPATLPQDRTFRAAWKPEDGTIAVDMGKAAEIHKDALRKVRAPLLADLDREQMTAISKGDTKAAADIEAKKQALRDVTADPDILAAKTPEDLKAAIPAILKT